MIPNLRLRSQQLVEPSFHTPKELVGWMGAMQAQDYNMVKWAVATRLQDSNIGKVDEALARGDILRTHVMRPTWHLVPAEDIRWMLKLTEKRLTSVIHSYGKKHDLVSSDFVKCNKLFEKILEGNKHLTKEELLVELTQHGLKAIKEQMGSYLAQGEIQGLICSGADKGKKVTYALIEERVPKGKNLTTDEALAKLASRYFQSHSPATLADFVWWSGLSLTESRHAIDLIQGELILDKFEATDFFVHNTWKDMPIHQQDTVQLLPSYDEYIISYKDRTDVLNLEHYPQAFTNYGIFYPLILLNGMAVGNWKKVVKKGKMEVEASFFDLHTKIEKELLDEAIRKYIATFI